MRLNRFEPWVRYRIPSSRSKTITGLSYRVAISTIRRLITWLRWLIQRRSLPFMALTLSRRLWRWYRRLKSAKCSRFCLASFP